MSMRTESIESRGVVPFRSVHVPTDFSQGSHRAFEHALRLAVDGQTELRLLHVGKDKNPPWDEFPGVRHTLARWGVLDRNSDKSDVLELGVEPTKFFLRTRNPVKAILKDLETSRPDLIVMATHARLGLARIFQSSLCKKVARYSHLPTLMVPHGSEGLVEENTGRLTLERVLIPISPEVAPARAVKLAGRFVATLNCEKVVARLIYIGEKGDGPAIDVDNTDKMTWEYVSRPGEVLDELNKEVTDFKPDLVVMMSRGRDSVMDTFMPGKLETLTGFANCPILTENVAF